MYECVCRCQFAGARVRKGEREVVSASDKNNDRIESKLP
jgi:hypothetical protein